MGVILPKKRQKPERTNKTLINTEQTATATKSFGSCFKICRQTAMAAQIGQSSPAQSCSDSCKRKNRDVKMASRTRAASRTARTQCSFFIFSPPFFEIAVLNNSIAQFSRSVKTYLQDRRSIYAQSFLLSISRIRQFFANRWDSAKPISYTKIPAAVKTVAGIFIKRETPPSKK